MDTTNGDLVFRPRLWLAWRNAILLTVLACSVLYRGHHLMAAAAMPAAKGWSAMVLLLGGILSFRALAKITATVRGLPRLTVGESGVCLKTLFRTHRADWRDLGLFQPAAVDFLYFSRPRLKAVAPVIGRRTRRQRKFIIQDIFEARVPAILDTIGHWQPGAGSAITPGEQYARPWVTLALVSLLPWIFAIQQVVTLDFIGSTSGAGLLLTPSVAGINRWAILQNGEWYRLLTAPWLHVTPIHLVANCVCLLLAGLMLERLIGHIWLLATFILGGLGGALMSLLLNPDAMTSVGASGAIMALFTALLVGSFRYPSGPARVRLQVRCVYILVLSLAPVATQSHGVRIDIAAHVGGALAGAWVMGMLLPLWARGEIMPPFRWAASTVCAIGLLATGTGFALASQSIPRYVMLQKLIPQREFPKTWAEAETRAPDLVTRFPDDPRAHMADAWQFIHRNDYREAEQQLRWTLRTLPNARILLRPGYEELARGLLVWTLTKEGNWPEARTEASTICQPVERAKLEDFYKTMLANGKLCG